MCLLPVQPQLDYGDSGGLAHDQIAPTGLRLGGFFPDHKFE